MELSNEDCKKFQGWWEKKSPSWFGGWQKRYFKILDGKVMVYSENENDTQPKGHVQLSQITDAVSVEKKVFKFGLEGREFVLKAEDNATKDKWIYVLNTLISNLQQSAIPSRSNTVDFTAQNKISKEGRDIQGDERKRQYSIRANKMEAIDKNTLNLLKAHGFASNEDDEKLSKSLLTKLGIDKWLNWNDPKIQSRIHYGFWMKKPKMKQFYQKRWLFLLSSRPLSDDKYMKDETNLDDKKRKKWLLFDVLFFFDPDQVEKSKDFPKLHSLDLSKCHKWDPSEKEDKFYLGLDIEDRRLEFYSLMKGERDRWFEVLKNSRRTAKEFKASITKNPRNVEIISAEFEKGNDNFKRKLEEERSQVVGNYKEIIEYNILEFTLTNLENLIETTIDGCSSNEKPKIELLATYSDYMNTAYLSIVQYFWETQYNNMDSANLIKLAIKWFDFEERLWILRISDPNFSKNAKELVKIYMKKTFKNVLDVIENILKSEREDKGWKNENGILYTRGPNDLFDILSKTFDLIKEYKNKYLYEQTFNLFHECIIQYLIGVDCVTSNYTIQVDSDFLLAIANNSFNIVLLLSKMIEDSTKTNLLNENQIGEAFRINQIRTSVNLMTQNSLSRFVGNYANTLSKTYEQSNYLQWDVTKALIRTNELFGPYKQAMFDTTAKKCWEEILKLNIFYYIKSLLTTARKQVKTVEELTNKLKYDHDLIQETFETIVGPNLTEANLKILIDVSDFFEISSSLISSSCLTLRDYLGPSFTITTVKMLIKLRCDFSSDEKKDAIEQCREVLEKYQEQGTHNNAGGFFAKMNEEIRNEIEDENDWNEDLLNVDDVEIERQKNTNVTSWDEFLMEDNEEEEDEEEVKQEEQVLLKQEIQEEVNDIKIEGKMKKKSYGIYGVSQYQERYFQLKNGYLYWFKDQKSLSSQNKLSIEKTLRVESTKDKNFLIVVSENMKDPKEIGKIYKFRCVNEEQKQAWMNALTLEMKRLKGEEQQNKLARCEIKMKKKMILDWFKLNEVGKDRTYMKVRTNLWMEKETFFKPAVVKEKKTKGKDVEYKNTPSSWISTNSSRMDETQKEGAVQQFSVEEVPSEEEKGGFFSCCTKCWKSILGGNGETETTEKWNPK